ncbi:MAG: hypothetical protein ACREIA_09980 [Opitutaceae bacterium]
MREENYAAIRGRSEFFSISGVNGIKLAEENAKLSIHLNSHSNMRVTPLPIHFSLRFPSIHAPRPCFPDPRTLPQSWRNNIRAQRSRAIAALKRQRWHMTEDAEAPSLR